MRAIFGRSLAVLIQDSISLEALSEKLFLECIACALQLTVTPCLTLETEHAYSGHHFAFERMTCACGYH